MKHVKTILSLGVLVAVVPFLGFPSSWKNFIFAALGLLISFFAYRVLLMYTHERTVRNESYEESVMPGTLPIHE